jgi:hypothetical protein
VFFNGNPSGTAKTSSPIGLARPAAVQRLLLSNRTVQKEPLRASNTAGAAHHFAENRDLHRCFSIRARHDAMGGILSAIPGYEIVPA